MPGNWATNNDLYKLTHCDFHQTNISLPERQPVLKSFGSHSQPYQCNLTQRREIKILETSSNSPVRHYHFLFPQCITFGSSLCCNDDVSRKQDGRRQIYTWIAFFVVLSQFPWKLLTIMA